MNATQESRNSFLNSLSCSEHPLSLLMPDKHTQVFTYLEVLGNTVETNVVTVEVCKQRVVHVADVVLDAARKVTIDFSVAKCESSG